MFDIELGIYEGPRNKISKSWKSKNTYQCKENSEINVKNPVLTIKTSDNLSSLNYAFIKLFNGRYYFVTNRVAVANGLWRLQLVEDVLMTYREQLKTTRAAFNRSSDFYNTYLPDDRAPVTQRQVVTNKLFPSSPFDGKIAEHGCIVTIAGASK